MVRGVTIHPIAHLRNAVGLVGVAGFGNSCCEKKETKKKSRYVKLPANSQVGEGPRIDVRYQGRISFAWSRNTSLDLLSRLNLAIL